MSYKITNKIPYKKQMIAGSKFDAIPIEKMKVGDSIKLTDIGTHGYGHFQSIYRVGIMTSQRNKNICGNFKVGVHRDKKVNELRVWRLK